MLIYLCGLSPDQWQTVHASDPSGTTDRKPEGYKRSGLYEGRDTFWLIQYAGQSYRYWNYSDVFDPPNNAREREELLEVAVNATQESARLRQAAEELLDHAAEWERIAEESYNAALVGK